MLGVLSEKLQHFTANMLCSNFVKSVSQEFLGYDPSLSFVFDSTRSFFAFERISRLPEPLKPVVRTIIFTRGCLGRIQDGPGLWQPHSPHEHYWLPVLKSLSSLKSLGVEVKIRENQLLANTLTALRVGTELLREGEINVLHLLYRAQQTHQSKRMGHGGPIRLSLAPPRQDVDVSSQSSPQIEVDEVIQGFDVKDIQPWTLDGNQPWLSDERGGGSHRQHIERLVRVTRQA